MIDALNSLKQLFESVIIESGSSGIKSLITSSRIINMLHEVVKAELVENGVNPNLINPPIGFSSPEVRLAGFLKFKKQDVCVFPNHIHPIRETLNFNGLHTGKHDEYGELFSEHILTINLRSQLSSLANNIDTMFERTYAEPLNLHRRVPKMVLGEVYLLAAREYDNKAVAEHRVAYAPITMRTANAIETRISMVLPP